MSLLQTAKHVGILDRACEILSDATQEVTDQISTGAAQIRAYRLWLSDSRRRTAERGMRR